MNILRLLKEILFPKYCLSCGKLGVYVCTKCSARLRQVRHDTCPYCKRRSYFGLTHPACKGRYRLDGLKSLYYYDSLVKKIIENIKYRLVREAIGDFLHTVPRQKRDELLFYKKITPRAILVPIPLHKERARARGFNQSADLARYFSKILGFKIDEKILYRKKNTKPQAKLKTSRERYINTIGAFGVVEEDGSLHKDDVILVDDVWTSGSTLKQAASVLKKNCISRVFALTVARG